MSTKPIERDAKGIPLKSPYPEGTSVVRLYSVMTFILTAIGALIAYFTCYYTDAKVDAANRKIAMMAEYELGWLYLGIFLIRILALPMNISLGSALGTLPRLDCPINMFTKVRCALCVVRCWFWVFVYRLLVNLFLTFICCNETNTTSFPSI